MSLISYAKTWAAGDVLYAADLEAMKAAITAAVNGGLDDSNIVSAANIALSKLGDYSADISEMRTQTAPWDGTNTNPATDLRGEIARVRSIIATITGQTYWYLPATLGVTGFTTGDWKFTDKTTADTGWIMMTDGTIGNASSSASNRANADTLALFTLYWTNYTDAQCPLSSGTRAGDVTAAASFAANKNIRLPLRAGRVMGVAGTPASANITDSYTGTTSGNGNAGGTTIIFDGTKGPTTADIFLNYTLKLTSGGMSGQTRTVSAYTNNGTTATLTVSAAFGAPTQVPGSVTFSLYKTVTTRALGDTVGITDKVVAISNEANGTGTGPDLVVGFPADAAQSMTNYPPTWFGNAMIKL